MDRQMFNPSKMHTAACAIEQNAQAMQAWERFMQTELFTAVEFSTVTRLIFTCPKFRKTSVMLMDVFPALNGATLAPMSTEYTPDIEIIERLGNVRAHGMLSFDTLHHGQVHLLTISVAENPTAKDQCEISLTNESPESLDFMFTMTNHGDLDNVHLFFTTLVVPFAGCKTCSKKTSSMTKCMQCWDTMQFPIWYCGKQCEHADGERHRTQEGCGTLNRP